MIDTVIKSCRCDICHTRGIGVEYGILGTPTLFVCRACKPEEVSAAASRVVFAAVVEALLEAV
jgi:hypothetical protein